MSSTAPSSSPDDPAAALRLPAAPALVAGLTAAHWLSPDGESEEIALNAALARARAEPPMLCHGPATARRLKAEPFPAFDLLELFAFVRPARFCPPTPRGLAEALGLTMPANHAEEALALVHAARALLRELAAADPHKERDALPIAWTLAQAGWLWGPFVLHALGYRESEMPPRRAAGLRVWERLPEWQEHAPEPPPGHEPVSAAEARARLAELLGEEAEPRPQQADYASATAAAFQPRVHEDAPHMVLAEAGTGVGKTLGYIAPASVWAEKNRGAVWISTFTRNLQHQIDTELDRLFPEASEKARRVVVRKGRENYLCLLNLDEAVSVLPQRPNDALAVGLMARWARRTRDGDMVGGDFPGWLADLVGRGRTLGLTDRRGECIYAACQHYRKCFIERSIRRARRAEIVVANHALVLIQGALGGGEEGAVPQRLVFDEGHHLFEAADSAFAAHLSGRETAELRRWLLGAEVSRSASRIRGLKRRIEDLVAGGAEDMELLSEALGAARVLAAEGWHRRLADGDPWGPTEGFLALVRQQVYARAPGADGPYSLECPAAQPVPGLEEAASALDGALKRLYGPLERLRTRLKENLDEEAGELDSETRRRIEATVRTLERRALMQIAAWRDMLAALLKGETPERFVDWFSVERIDGRDIDVGFYRHWVDPTEPLADAVLQPAHGVLVTSATLRDGSGEPEADWQAAEARTGALHLDAPAIRAQVPSPFDYPGQTRVFVVNDVRKDDLNQVAAAYRALFLASDGGALGLFTAISRLKAVHGRIAAQIEAAGLPLHAQHLDGLDVSTLVDIFRAEEDACLLGTDAVRDGVDVPGRSLRLIVFDRVPWPRPDLRHKARRERFGARRYDDMLTRLRLKQAFGRLVRRGDDHGVFVLLDPMMPTRLTGAFPEGVEVKRCGLAEAVAEIRTFLADPDAQP